MKTLKIIVTCFAMFFSIKNSAQLSWTLSTNGLPSSLNITDFEGIGTDVYACGTVWNGTTTAAAIYKTVNNGINWLPVISNGLPQGLEVFSFLHYNNKYFISGLLPGPTVTCGLYTSTDNAQNWSLTNNGLPSKFLVRGFEISGGEILASGKYVNGSVNEIRIYKSTDNGNSWNQIITTDLSGIEAGNALIKYNSKLFLSGTVDISSTIYTVMVSSDNGQSWTGSATGLPAAFVIEDFVLSGNIIFAVGTDYSAGSQAAIYKSADGAASWSMVTTSGLASMQTGNAIHLNNSHYFLSGLNPPSGEVYVSADIETGIENYNEGQKISVFPNPVHDELFIHTINGKNQKYFILSSSGQIVKTGYLQNGNNCIDVDYFATDIYILKIENGYNFKIKKI